MAKKTKPRKDTAAAQEQESPLQPIVDRLEATLKEVTELGEDRCGRAVARALKATRYAIKQRAARMRRVGGMIAAMKAKGLTAEEIVAKLS